MTPIRSCVAILVATALGWTTIASVAMSDSDDLRVKLLTEGPQGWERIDRFTENLEVKVDDLRDDKDGKLGDRYQWHAKYSGGNVCLVRTRFKDDLATIGSVLCRNAKYGFLLKMRRERSTLDDPVRRSARYSKAKRTLCRRRSAIARWPFLSGSPHHLRTFVNWPGVKLLSVKDIDRLAGPLVEVEFESPKPQESDEAAWATGGTFRLDPACHWAVKDYDIEVVDNSGQRTHWECRLDFELSEDNLPRCAAEEYRTFELEKIGRQRWVWEFQEFRPGKISDAEFTPAAFGVPYAIDPPSTSPTRWRLLVTLSLAAVAAILLVMLARHAGQHPGRQCKSPGGPISQSPPAHKGSPFNTACGQLQTKKKRALWHHGPPAFATCPMVSASIPASSIRTAGPRVL